MSYQDQLSPWVVYRLLPNCQRLLIERFRYRNNAEDYLRVLKRLQPHVQFELVFEVETDSVTWPKKMAGKKPAPQKLD